MRILQIFLILIGISTTVCPNERQDVSPIHQTKIKLRRFGIFQMRQIREIIRAYEMREKLNVQIQRQEIERQNNEILKEEAKRRNIFVQRLLPHHLGSSVLRDFHTNRI
jgi:maltose-binding protein MalE